jgi:single-strand DNA-binding protein
MASFNQVILMGHMTRDPQLKYLPSQTAVVEFGLAVNRKWKDAQGNEKEDVCFVDCSCFGKRGEVINQYFTKGKPIFVCGRLNYQQWEDKQGGGKRSKLTVVVEDFQFVGDNRGGGGQSDQDGSGRTVDRSGGMDQTRARPPQQQSRGPAPAAAAPQQGGPEQHFDDADIPF